MSPLFIMQGAWYSLEQCGLLLADASDRFGQARHGTAVALALLAREELGKARLLIEIFRETLRGQPTILDDVRTQLRDHRAKQEAAVLSIAFSGEQATRQDSLLMQAFEDIGSAASEAARQEYVKALRERAKALPRERRTLREQGLYVDPSEAGTAWERPMDLPREVAEQTLLEALNDYSGLLFNLANHEMHADVRATLPEWPQHPNLPAPAWPK